MPVRVIAAWCAALAFIAAAPARPQALPPDIAKSKVVRAALNTGYPPLETRDPATNQPVGFDIDLAAAMAKILGVTMEYQDGSFEQMTPSLQSGRVDMIISGFYDIPRRRPFFDFVDYLRAGAQLFGLKSNTEITTLADLCGKTITTGRGSSYPETARVWSEKTCVAAGKSPLVINTETDFAQELSSLKQGRADAVVTGLEAIPTVMEREPDTYRTFGPPISSALMGMAFQKDDPTLLNAFQFALKQVIADGQYAALIKKWKLDFSAYPDATINAGPQP